ncbi:hypothetical protein [Micromonospora sp. NPDC005652]|uniref:hypothetical protein n=1 Tax=Micromonospora sp. NPDC005652 TaxID=3157046 RepID=UPI003404FC55
MGKRMTVVRLPDGTVERRGSTTKHYTHAVVCEWDRRAHAAGLRDKAEQAQRASDLAHEIVASGDLSRLVRKVTGISASGRHYSSYVPGSEDFGSLPDYRDREAWDRYAADSLARMKARPDELRAEAAEADAEAPMAYGVWRWSERRDNAEKAAAGFQGKALPGQRFVVVEVEQES